MQSALHFVKLFNVSAWATQPELSVYTGVTLWALYAKPVT